MAIKSAEKQAKINEAQSIRLRALDSISLSLASRKINSDEAAKWIDLIFRCRSLADIKRLKAMLDAITGLYL